MATGDPTIWKSSLKAFLIGLPILFIPDVAELIRDQPLPGRDIVRDIGIAFIVASIVSFMYEWSTRVTAEQHKMKSVLRTVMSSFVPEEVWNEVNNEILHRMVVRRNFDLRLKLYRNGEKLPIGKTVDLPDTQAVLWTRTRYDLYGLMTERRKVQVTHYLDEHMRNQKMELPCFTRVRVMKAGSRSRRDYSGNKLGEVYDGQKGCLKLAGEHRIELEPLGERKAVRIWIERYEIVSTPGLYTLVMPEMVVPYIPDTVGSTRRPTIRIRVKPPSPKWVDFHVFTWFWTPERDFKKVDSKDEWIFTGVMLPGQGFSMAFIDPYLPLRKLINASMRPTCR